MIIAPVTITEETSEELRNMYTLTSSRDFQDAILLELGKRACIPLDPNKPIPTQHPKEKQHD